MPDTPNRNRSVDDRKWSAAANLVRSWGEFRKAVDAYGAISPEAKEALVRAEAALKTFKKMQKVVS